PSEWLGLVKAVDVTLPPWCDAWRMFDTLIEHVVDRLRPRAVRIRVIARGEHRYMVCTNHGLPRFRATRHVLLRSDRSGAAWRCDECGVELAGPYSNPERDNDRGETRGRELDS